MNKTILVVPVLALALTACDNKSEPAAGGGSGSGNVLSAPADYVGAAAKAHQSAVKTVDTLALSNAIQLFAGEQGRYPKDLNELVSKKYIKEIPQPPAGMEIKYDAATGKVTVSAQ